MLPMFQPTVLSVRSLIYIYIPHILDLNVSMDHTMYGVENFLVAIQWPCMQDVVSGNPEVISCTFLQVFFFFPSFVPSVKDCRILTVIGTCTCLGSA